MIFDQTTLTLFILGMLGQIVQLLLKMDSLKKQAPDKFKAGQFFALEAYTIIASVIIIFVASVSHEEWAKDSQLNGWVMVGMFCDGYMAQSVLTKVIGRAKKILDNIDSDKPTP